MRLESVFDAFAKRLFPFGSVPEVRVPCASPDEQDAIKICHGVPLKKLREVAALKRELDQIIGLQSLQATDRNGILAERLGDLLLGPDRTLGLLKEDFQDRVV